MLGDILVLTKLSYVDSGSIYVLNLFLAWVDTVLRRVILEEHSSIPVLGRPIRLLVLREKAIASC